MMSVFSCASSLGGANPCTPLVVTLAIPEVNPNPGETKGSNGSRGREACPGLARASTLRLHVSEELRSQVWERGQMGPGGESPALKPMNRSFMHPDWASYLCLACTNRVSLDPKTPLPLFADNPESHSCGEGGKDGGRKSLP